MMIKRIAVTVLAAMGWPTFVTGAHAQEPLATIECQYLTVTKDLEVVNAITPVFETGLIIETNKNQTKLTRVSGLTGDADGVAFAATGVVTGGKFFAELDAEMKETDDPETTCVGSAKVSGVGQLEFPFGTWLIRDMSRLDGKTRLSNDPACPFDGFDGTCSVHSVKATLRFTVQELRGNDSPKYDRFSWGKKDIIDATTNQGQITADDLVLACSCDDSLVEPVEEE
ncbi:MAG: hypothetical protein AAF637_06090 [Pseudomonadota bacterium]